MGGTRQLGKESEKSMQVQKVKAYAAVLQKNEGFWNGLIVFLGALFILSAIPFFPLMLVPLIALLCGFIALKNPPLGMLLSVLLAFPAFMYQSYVLAYLYILVVAVVLFEMWDHWKVISCLQILIFAPFSPAPLSYIGWFTILGMALAVFHFGSKKSLMISIPAVFMILFLSSIWMVDNNAFLPIDKALYAPPLESLQLSRPSAETYELGLAFSEALSNFLNFSKFTEFYPALGKSLDNTIALLFKDSGLVQLIMWAVVLYSMSWLAGQIRGKRSQVLSSLVLLTIPLLYYFLIPALDFVGLLLATVASIAVIGIAEQIGFRISQERRIKSEERTKQFGKFGLTDLSASEGGEKSLDDIGDYEDMKQELRDAIMMPLEQKELAYTYNLKPPSGILLFGPPGTGKTMLMRALAKDLRYGFYYIKSSDILSQWYGESEKNISEIFSVARKNSPSLLFFDEIDSVGKKRTEYTADDVGPRVLSTILQEMDGLKTDKPVIVVGATNVPQKLDPALMRPGRFDKIIYMHLPPKEARVEIFKVHLSKVPVGNDIDLGRLADKTDRFSGADIKNVVNQALGIAAKQAGAAKRIVPISMDHLMQVIRNTKPSTSISSLEQYEEFRMDFERRTGGVKEKEKEKEEKKAVGWNDVAGLDDVKEALLETVQLPLLQEDKLKEFDVKPSKGILLFGPPGTGKTLIVRAAAGELNASFINLSGAELMKEGYAKAVTLLKEAFNRARENPPTIMFLDEIDTIATSRGVASSDILGQLLTEMDGMKGLKQVVVVAATNKPSVLDPAILRPGRFDKIFYIPAPDRNGREEVFRIHLGRFAQGIDLRALAEITDGFSGADIASICQQAKMKALKNSMAGQGDRITSEMLAEITKKRRPSITGSNLREYEQFLDEYGERR
ncbi:MAG: AAA family ATPase [Candidatus Bilamarchaeaceae archaeon]